MEIVQGNDEIPVVKNVFQHSAFVAACRQMLPFIEEAFRKQHHRNELPTAVLTFLCEHLRLTHCCISGMWKANKSLIYGQELNEFDHLMRCLSSHRDGVLSLHRLGLGMLIPSSFPFVRASY